MFSWNGAQMRRPSQYRTVNGKDSSTRGPLTLGPFGGADAELFDKSRMRLHAALSCSQHRLQTRFVSPARLAHGVDGNGLVQTMHDVVDCDGVADAGPSFAAEYAGTRLVFSGCVALTASLVGLEIVATRLSTRLVLNACGTTV